MIWSFDDLNIGRIAPGSSSLGTREIYRPKGLTNSVWYLHASAVCSILNGLK